ncbi:hypothetical protein P4O66_017534, partial [Electrophorus voltai]
NTNRQRMPGKEKRKKGKYGSKCPPTALAGKPSMFLDTLPTPTIGESSPGESSAGDSSPGESGPGECGPSADAGESYVTVSVHRDWCNDVQYSESDSIDSCYPTERRALILASLQKATTGEEPTGRFWWGGPDYGRGRTLLSSKFKEVFYCHFSYIQVHNKNETMFLQDHGATQNNSATDNMLHWGNSPIERTLLQRSLSYSLLQISYRGELDYENCTGSYDPYMDNHKGCDDCGKKGEYSVDSLRTWNPIMGILPWTVTFGLSFPRMTSLWHLRRGPRLCPGGHAAPELLQPVLKPRSGRKEVMPVPTPEMGKVAGAPLWRDSKGCHPPNWQGPIPCRQ